MKVQVRKGFVVWLDPQKHYTEGEQIDVTDEQYQKIKHQVEPVAPPNEGQEAPPKRRLNDES